MTSYEDGGHARKRVMVSHASSNNTFIVEQKKRKKSTRNVPLFRKQNVCRESVVTVSLSFLDHLFFIELVDPKKPGLV